MKRLAFEAPFVDEVEASVEEGVVGGEGDSGEGEGGGGLGGGGWGVFLPVGVRMRWLGSGWVTA